MTMKLQIIVILLATIGITAGLAQLGDDHISITITPEGKAKISQSIFPESFVSTIDVHVITDKISNLLAIDEQNILLGTTQNEDLLKIATLGASSVNLKYNADILSYESGVFRLKYSSEIESKVNLPPLSKLVSLNTIPIEITDREYVLPSGDISLSFSIRPVTSKEFFIAIDDSEYKIEAITASKIEEFSANSKEIQFIIKDKAVVLTIIPTKVMANPNDVLLNGEKAEFSQFHQNSTHSWIRIDPHEKGLVKIQDTTEKIEEGGGCLIATATYGSEMAPQVQLLREIRDNQLMSTDSGVSFMTGFNQFYYSFSPFVADMERDNPMFKEIVKIGITPLLSSLSVMEYAETDSEILGLGISVILMNIGMYFVFPFVICYQSMTVLRTRGVKKSSWVVISNCNVRSVLKIGTFGLIALFALSVSVPSAFAQTVDENSESPIKMVLDLTLTNLEESILDPTREIPSTAQTFYQMGQGEYQLALDALDEGNVEAAEEHALIAMALFEDSASVIGELEESLVLGQLPPGFGSAVGSASETGTTSGQGLGVGGIPAGIMKQMTAANVFDISEQIADIEEEVDELRQLAESNGVDINLVDYDKSINLAKTVLANGEIPNAQAKIEVANTIKGEIYAEIQKAAGDNAREGIEELLEDQKNLGLTKKAINDLEDILKDFTTEDEGSSVDDIVENSGDEAPGNSGDAPGQNNDKFESPKDIPGFGSASETGKENGNGQGVGLGNIPPGLAKLFGTDDIEDLPPGLANVPPGQAKKFDDYSSSFAQSPDDYYENSFEADVDDIFETNYDGTNKGKGDGKGMFGAWAGKSGQNPTTGQFINQDKGQGNSGCTDKGIADGDSGNTGPFSIGFTYIVDLVTAKGLGCNDVTNSVFFDVTAPNGTDINGAPTMKSPPTFRPDTSGTWTIDMGVQVYTEQRIITVDPTPGFTADAGSDQLLVAHPSTVNLDGIDSSAVGAISYEWSIVRISGGGPPISLNNPNTQTPDFNILNPHSGNEYELTLIVRDSLNYGYMADTLTVTVS